jgi:ribosomal protein L37E
MNPEEKTTIIQALENRGARLPCPRCGNNNFSLIDGYFNHSFQSQITSNVIIGGPSVPSVAVVCNRCGFLSYHAVGALGILPDQSQNNEQASTTSND